MLYKVLTLSLISVMCVDGIEPEKISTRAISVQSFQRKDIPVSYQVTSYHDYTTPSLPPQAQDYAIAHQPALIQYAPLRPQYKEYHRDNEDNLETAERKINKNHLEPRFENVENLEAHNNHLRSFVPGHNVEVLPSLRHNALMNALYHNFHEYLQSQKVNIPKYNIEEQPKRTLFDTGAVDEEDPPTQIPIKNSNIVHKIFPAHPYASHVESDKSFLQVPHPKVPRLHLNIARVYGLAHIPHKVPKLKAMNENEKINPSRTRAIIKPQKKTSIVDKTLLFPVEDFRKYFPTV